MARAWLVALVLLAPLVASTVTVGPGNDARGAISERDLVIWQGAVIQEGSTTPPQVGLLSGGPWGSMPFDGANGTILSTGDVLVADTPGPFPLDTDLGGASRDVFDVATVHWSLLTTSDRDCLWVPLQFMTEEVFPGRAPDGVYVELDADTWLGAGTNAGFAIDADGALTSDHPVMSAAEALGTPFELGSPLLTARTPLPPGLHDLRVSIYDGQDGNFDSAVAVDGVTAMYTGHFAAGPISCPATMDEVPRDATFSHQPDPMNACQDTKFTTSGNYPSGTKYAWRFSDLHTSLSNTPTIRLNEGKHEVTLVITEPSGDQHWASRIIEPQGVCALKALPGGPYTAARGGTINIVGNGADGVPGYTCSWMGDPNLAITDADNCAAQVSADVSGDHYLGLTVTDRAGNTALGSTVVQVGTPAETDPTYERPQDGGSSTPEDPLVEPEQPADEPANEPVKPKVTDIEIENPLPRVDQDDGAGARQKTVQISVPKDPEPDFPWFATSLFVIGAILVGALLVYSKMRSRKPAADPETTESDEQ